VGFHDDFAPFIPGYDASRLVDRTEFSASGTQTLTITATPKEPLLDLNIQVRIPESQFVNPTFSLPITGEADHVHLSDDGRELFIGIYSPIAEKLYTFQITIEVNLKPDVSQAEFMPWVSLHSQREVTTGTATASSITHTMPAVGTWTWSATGSYLFDWHETTLGLVNFEGYSRGMVNEVWVNFITHWGHMALGDTFTNHEVTGGKTWGTEMQNALVPSGQSVTTVNLALASQNKTTIKPNLLNCLIPKA